MKIQRDNDPCARSGKLAHERDDAAVRVFIVGRKHGAVIGDIDGIERSSSRQARPNSLEEAPHKRPVDRAVRMAACEQDRQR